MKFNLFLTVLTLSASVVVSVAPAAAEDNDGGDTGPLDPAQAAETFTVEDGLEFEQVLAEPTIRQPVFFNFDERGRMWVVEYVQYPYPAGLKMLSRDKYWRAVYDKTPPPPPNHFQGKDRISIHEDTDGDGTFEEHKVFLDGLSIVTACVKGRGGVWVLNPPYLLFYPDENNDDVPDGDPEVHLKGFGLQDTHSVVNSLRWGPDGWLYAAQGSTVTANVVRPGIDEEEDARFSMGQHIWRYHPETRRYEIFAQGGGNAFGVEIDAEGRIYSGHNGGNTRGFHYVQGGYYRKTFQKHGPLSNPYAFGYFPAMPHHDVPRFTHNFVIYEADAFPERHRDQIYGIVPLHNRLVRAEMRRRGSTFETEDRGYPVESSDERFRPVDVKLGPDGAIYVADFYEKQISHRDHFQGNIEKENGRIYRLKAKDAEPLQPFDLGDKSTRELIGVLEHPNKWFRQQAQRLIADRRDASIIPLLEKKIRTHTGQLALECLWALNASGGFDERVAQETLKHENPHVRKWTVRLLCDDHKVSPNIAVRLMEMAGSEPRSPVRSQLACSARRLSAGRCLRIVGRLLHRDEDRDDPHIPLLLWWAIESKCGSHAETVLSLFREDTDLWKRPIVTEHILSRLMKRFAKAGSRDDLLSCACLFQMAPDKEATQKLMQGFEEAFEGRALTGLPAKLVNALDAAGGGSVALGIRQGRPEAVENALSVVADAESPREKRFEYVRIFGEVSQPECVSVLLDVFRQTDDKELRQAVLTALGRYGKPQIGRAVLDVYEELSKEVREAALTLLVSRKAWTLQLLEAVDTGRIDPQTIPAETVRKMTVHSGDRIAALVDKHWGKLDGATTAEMQQRIGRFAEVVRSGSGDPYRGKKLFQETCAKCHVLFGQGGRVGPDLTSYKRDDVRRMLVNIVNPSAEIREGFENHLVLTTDGRVLNGFVADQDQRVVVLRGPEGQKVSVERDDIAEMRVQQKSLMPEGLLKELSDKQVRDLFAYFRTTQPLND